MPSDQASGRTSLLIVRAWFDSGQLRARVTTTLDLEAETETVRHYDSPAGVEAAVHEWLDSLSPS